MIFTCNYLQKAFNNFIDNAQSCDLFVSQLLAHFSSAPHTKKEEKHEQQKNLFDLLVFFVESKIFNCTSETILVEKPKSPIKEEFENVRGKKSVEPPIFHFHIF